MKCLALFLILLWAAAQTRAQVADEPAFRGEAKALLTGHDQLLALDRRTAGVKVTGFGVSKQVFYFDGPQAAALVRSAELQAIVFRVADQNINPRDLAVLIKLEQKRNVREFVNAKATAFGIGDNSGTGAINQYLVASTFEKYGSSSIALKPISPLAPGEYALRLKESGENVFHCFRVE
jgi:hypothetical protein